MGLGVVATPGPAWCLPARKGHNGHLSEQEARMSVSNYADDLGSAVHYARETTHAIAVCPFHLDVTIRIGDDPAESHCL